MRWTGGQAGSAHKQGAIASSAPISLALHHTQMHGPEDFQGSHQQSLAPSPTTLTGTNETSVMCHLSAPLPGSRLPARSREFLILGRL
jgi:hypothetical protein